MAAIPLPTPTALTRPHPDPPTTADPTPTDAGHRPAKTRKTNPAHTLHTSTLRSQPYAYFHLRLTTSSPPPSSSPSALDALTIRTLLTPPLQQYLGLTGAAIPIDILKSDGWDVWVRIARQDGRAVWAALGGWVGSWEGVRVQWRVVKAGKSLGLTRQDSEGAELFGDGG